MTFVADIYSGLPPHRGTEIYRVSYRLKRIYTGDEVDKTDKGSEENDVE